MNGQDVVATFPHKVGDDVYLGKTRKCKSTMSLYICKEAVQDINLAVGEIVKCDAKSIECGVREMISGVVKNNPCQMDRDEWPMFVELIPPKKLERGMKVYFRLIPVDVLEWFDSLEEVGLTWCETGVRKEKGVDVCED